MSQIEHGIRSLLKYGTLYNLSQWALGATKARKELITKYVQPNMTVLDIGCGPGTIVPFLPSSVRYFGIDSNPQYINYASSKFGSKFTFLCENANDINFLGGLPKFDLILALGLIHHLDDLESLKLFEFCAHAAKPSGKVLTLDGCYITGQSKIAKYFLDNDRGQNIRTEQAYRSLALHSFQNVVGTLSHTMFRIPYTALIMECSNPKLIPD